MKSAERRQEILSFLGNADNPVPANVLKDKFNVSVSAPLDTKSTPVSIMFLIFSRIFCRE